MLNKQPPSGSQATPPTTPSWFYKQIEFLDKHIKQRQRQSNCENTSDVSTDGCASVVRKEMPHEVIEMNIEDFETPPEGFQPDENPMFSISEEYAENSAAPDDEGDDWLNDMSTTTSTTDDNNNSTATANIVANRDGDVFKSPSPPCNKNPKSSGNGASHGFSEIASPSREKMVRKKRKIDHGDAALQESMVSTLDDLASSLRSKTKQTSEQQDQGSKGNNNDPVYDELLQYCTSLARRIANIPNEESRKRIRHAIEMIMFEHKFK